MKTHDIPSPITSMAARAHHRLVPAPIAAMASMAAIGAGTSLWWARAAMLVIGLGMSCVFIPAQAASFATISPERTGRASTLFNAARQLGGAAGVAVLTTVLAAAQLA